MNEFNVNKASIWDETRRVSWLFSSLYC